MTRAQAILLTLIGYKIVLILIGVWASRRTRDESDFFLGGRQLGPIVAALSASASSSSAWTILGVSGAAFAWGLSAIWLFPATVLGFVVNWFWVAPRVLPRSRAEGALTLTELVAGDGTTSLYMTIMRVSSVAIVFSFLFYVAAQFQAAGNAFSNAFGLSINASILIGTAIIVFYTMLGGFWAVSVTDTLQGLLMAGTAIVLPVVALMAVGGPGALIENLEGAAGGGLFGEHAGVAAIGFVIGTLGIGAGYPGQPHVINRFMALRDDRALRVGRLVAVGWALVVYSGMLVVGWCGRILTSEIADGEQIFFALANELLPAVVAGVMIAAVLSAIMSTADSQMLVAASSIAHDWRGGDRTGSSRASLVTSRVVVLVISLASMILAMFAPATIFTRVLFAWAALGSAFGPLLIVRLIHGRVSPRHSLLSIVTGFSLTVIFYLLPSAPGDWVERLVPFSIALVIAWLGRARPDRLKSSGRPQDDRMHSEAPD